MEIKRLAGDITEESVYILYENQRVGTLTKRVNDACEEEYVFRVDWDKWDRIKPAHDIDGLLMDLRKEEYVRPFVPSFITAHMPPYGREDIPEHMAYYGLTGEYDMWDFMCACHRNTNDRYTVVRVEEYEEYMKSIGCTPY